MSFEGNLIEELLPICSEIYPLNAPEGTSKPYITYTSSEGSYDKDLNGFQNFKEVPCQLDIISSTYSNLKNLSKQVIDKLKTFENRNIGTNGFYIEELTFDDDSPELYESEVLAYRKIISFRVYFKEE